MSKRDSGPELWRAIDWTPFEISAVPIGADAAAGFRWQDRLIPCVVQRADAQPMESSPGAIRESG